MNACNACGATTFTPILDLGPLPVAHRFRRSPETEGEYRHPFAIHLCEDCGLVQIEDPIPPEDFYTDYNFCFSAWKSQPHMQVECDLLLKAVGGEERILEVGANDGTFLKVLGDAGFSKRVGVEPNPEAAEVARKTGATIHQGFFGPELAKTLHAEYGQFQAIASRQTVEHIIDLQGLMEGLKLLLKPGGVFLIEVPDFEVAFDHGDPSLLWEEHVNYFGEAVLVSWLAKHGFVSERVERFPFCGGALMVLARLDPERAALACTAEWKAKAKAFPAGVERSRKALQKVVETERAAGRTSLIFGAGNRANLLINAFGMQSEFAFLVDDQPEKQGLYAPGTAMRVVSSEALQENVGACFLAVNTENDASVQGRHSEWTGRFYSLCAPSAERLTWIEEALAE